MCALNGLSFRNGVNALSDCVARLSGFFTRLC